MASIFAASYISLYLHLHVRFCLISSNKLLHLQLHVHVYVHARFVLVFPKKLLHLHVHVRVRLYCIVEEPYMLTTLCSGTVAAILDHTKHAADNRPPPGRNGGVPRTAV